MPAWPAQPSPGELVRLPLALPPMLCSAAGYTGSARYLALHWTPYGDELVYADGTVSASGWWPAWTTLVEHPLGQALLGPYELGSSDTDARHRLLADQWEQTLDVGLELDVQQLLATQPSELNAAAEILGSDRMREVIETHLRQGSHPNVDEAKRQMHEANNKVTELRVWLDERLREIEHTAGE